MTYLRPPEKRIVLCHGLFDPPQYRHLKLFEAARRHGDFLIVTITADNYANGGAPLVTREKERLAVISAWRCVDYAEILYEKGSLPAIRMFQPHIYCREAGNGSFAAEKELMKGLGGKLVIIHQGEQKCG